MPILADTHVHLYPIHDADRLFAGAQDRLNRLGGGLATCAVVFAERQECHAFRDLRDGRLKPASFTVEPAGANGLRLQRPMAGALHVIAGRQIAARERLEVLALGVDAAFPDGEPIRDSLQRVREAGGLPVLAWAPGKWMFQRGKIVTALLEEAAPGSLLVGDTTLRPTWWPTPDLMSYASLKGLKVIAGSDPLPLAGEEAMAGRYASFLDASLDPGDPAASLQRILADPATKPMNVGRRGTASEVWHRLRALKQIRLAGT